MLKRVTIVTALGVTLWSGALVSASEPITDAEHKERFCMAEALFFETGNQPMIGILGAAEVILNRVKSERWPNTVCGVVHQGPINKWWKKRGKIVPVKWKCQFTYYCDGKSDDIQVVYYKGNMQGKSIGPNMEAWKQSVQVSLLAMYGVTIDPTSGATHYYNHNISQPSWGQVYPVVLSLIHI